MKIIANLKDVLNDAQSNVVVSFLIKNFIHKDLIKTLDASKTYSIEINEVKSKRSIQQNNMLWALMDEIDVAINGRPTNEYDIYAMCIERADAKHTYMYAVPEAEDDLKKVFRAIRKVSEVEIEGRIMNYYKCFYGSSKLNTKEMSLLIDTALDMAQEVGIETSYYKELI